MIRAPAPRCAQVITDARGSDLVWLDDAPRSGIVYASAKDVAERGEMIGVWRRDNQDDVGEDLRVVCYLSSGETVRGAALPVRGETTISRTTWDPSHSS